VLYGNRAASRINQELYDEALEDALRSTEIDPGFVKVQACCSISR